jgi:hypothetical protein
MKIEISETLISRLLDAIKSPTFGLTLVALFGVAAFTTICHALISKM